MWKTIEEMKNYEISEYGEIRNKKTGKLLKLNPDKDGYFRVCLSENNHHVTRIVHRLVAQAFIENPLKKETVNHIDGNKQNNHISNLEWATVTEQNRHALKTGLRNMKNDGCSKKVAQYDMKMNLIQTFPSANEARRQLGYSQGHISEVCRGEKASYKGFIWKYC